MSMIKVICVALLGGSGLAQAQDSFGGAASAPSGSAAAPVARPPAQAPVPGTVPASGTLPAPGMAPPSGMAAPGNDMADALTAMERQDFGVPASNQLHTGAMHGPTPASIPGGQLITTRGVQQLLAGGQTPVLLLDILGGTQIIPGARHAVPAAQPGSFNDPTQQQFGQFLSQATGGNKEVPLVLYCQSRECWMSYNAALRAIQLGYRNVLWYRGGIEAWQAAGLPLQPAGPAGPQR